MRFPVSTRHLCCQGLVLVSTQNCCRGQLYGAPTHTCLAMLQPLQLFCCWGCGCWCQQTAQTPAAWHNFPVQAQELTCIALSFACHLPQAFSAVGAMQGAWHLATGQALSFSEQQMVDCSWNYGNNGCQGGEMEPAIQVCNY
jgi:hypothetical protein